MPSVTRITFTRLESGIVRAAVRYYRSSMATISLKLPQPLADLLEERARNQQKPKSVLIREFIERGLEAGSSRPASFHEGAKSKCGIGSSGFRDLATNPAHLEGFGQ